ncbi:PREDICTED: uncharacterized protein LOC109589208 [Amphimedon queenslandica]|uniref:Uncharacterized protein n=1 Tax=Amphimedon queenslandica TaxID=400682 RepID=A0AAN0JVG0_AMPQE|nr:PREDICTED: uncharacterized protein LOC109589208 [Amphimedon queenslandica]|eukprot:XP_019860879.1 PREDICTED: uncharacterized protein LOC109589208 [Amphimedon queenslandica]
MSLLYNTGGAIGSIDVLVNSVDYYGRAVGNLSTQYQFNNYNFEVETIISNSMSLNVIMKDKFIIQQPAPLSCELTVTNLTQSSVDCLLDKLFVFTNVTEGDVYNYTVTVTNVIGSTFKNGSIEIPYLPLEVCPSKIQYSASAMIMMSPISSVSVMEPSTPASTSSDSCNCVLPWTVGVLIGVAVMIVALLVIIFIIIIYFVSHK